jgi:hypothetical protein
MVANLE